MSELGPPPEALLIERLRSETRPKLSIRAAAEAAGISDARWRQIAKGHNQASKDVRVPARAPSDTLARMAKVVRATPDQLREAGRADAADELQALIDADRAALGRGLASLIPTEIPHPAVEDPVEVLERIVAQTWREAHDLAAAVKSLDDAPEELRDVSRRIIFTLSGYLIMRLLRSGYAAELENWLQRIYTEREQLYRDVTVGPPDFPWATDVFADHSEAAAAAVRDWGRPKPRYATDFAPSDRDSDETEIRDGETDDALSRLAKHGPAIHKEGQRQQGEVRGGTSRVE